MKRLRMVRVLVLTLALLALALWGSPSRTGYGTPSACLDVYGEARRAGDVAKYRSCLGEPLRSEMERRFADADAWAEFLRESVKEVKSWVQLRDLQFEGS